MMFAPQPKRQRVKLSPGEWRILSDVVLEIDRWNCLACKGASGDWTVELHHMCPRSMFRLDVIGNLVTLCRACHRDVTECRLSLQWAEPVGEHDGVPLGGETPETRRVIVRRLR